MWWKITGKVAATVGKLAAATLLVSFLSIWTTGYVVNSYVETLLKQFHIPLEEQPFALSGLWGEMWGAHPSAKDDKSSGTADQATGSNGSNGSDGAANGDGNGSSGNKDSLSSSDNGGNDGSGATDGLGGSGDAGSSSGAGTGNSSGSGAENSAANGSGSGSSGTSGQSASSDNGDGSVDASGDSPDSGVLSDIGGGTGPKGNSGASSGQGQSGTGTGTGAGDATKDGVAMSTDQINASKSQMSQADRDQMFTLMKKLPQDAWQRISTLMEDGLTNEESTEVNQLMAQYLNRDEYDKLEAIMSKY